jgi:hypothetical protein
LAPNPPNRERSSLLDTGGYLHLTEQQAAANIKVEEVKTRFVPRLSAHANLAFSQHI